MVCGVIIEGDLALSMKRCIVYNILHLHLHCSLSASVVCRNSIRLLLLPPLDDKPSLESHMLSVDNKLWPELVLVVAAAGRVVLGLVVLVDESVQHGCIW